MQTEEKLEKLRTENGDLRLPPAWTQLIGMLVLGVSVSAVLIFDMMRNNNGENILAIPVIIGLFTFVVFKAKLAESYILTRQKIICKRFGKICREVPWQQVIQVGVATGAGLRGNWYIVVTLEGAEKFDPKTQKLKEYIDEWEDKLLVLPADKLRYAAFEKIYGKLDYDSYY